MATARETTLTGKPIQPDLGYIKTHISVVTVAHELGLHVTGDKARCWRTECHRNGDADPSIGFQKSENRWRCFVCDPHSQSNVDLVMSVLGCDLRQAVFWIADRFPVPSLPKGAHVRKREGWSPRFRVGVAEDVITVLVRSGLWSDLSASERSILPVIVTFTDRETGCAGISYRGLMRYSGVGSPATMSQALRHFEQLHLLQVSRKPGELLFRRVNQYRLTPDDPEFQTIATAVWRQQREEIELERQLRAEQKQARRAKAIPV